MKILRGDKVSGVWSELHRRGGSTPLISELDIKYQKEYYKDRNFEDVSFVIVDGDEPIAGMALSVDDNSISGFGRPAIYIEKDKKARDIVTEELIRLYSFSRNFYYCDELENGLSIVSSFLLNRGMKPKPVYSQIINLSKTKEQLHSELRKSYKSLCSDKNDGEYQLLTVGIESRFIDIFIDRFKKLHKFVSGRQTRSDETWQLQKKMLIDGCAYGIALWKPSSKGGQLQIEMPAAALFMYNDVSVYYAVAASIEGVNTHSLVWRAILKAKELGCNSFDMGGQLYSGNEKELNISKFKRGFGGETKVRLLFGNGN